MVILDVLATVLGAISCPVYCRFSPDVIAAMLVYSKKKEFYLFLLFGTPTWPLCLLSFVSWDCVKTKNYDIQISSLLSNGLLFVKSNFFAIILINMGGHGWRSW